MNLNYASTILLAALVSTSAAAEVHNGFETDDIEFVRVAERDANHASLSAVEHIEAREGSNCYSCRRGHDRHRSNGTGGAVLGALIGAAAGSQIGDGSGRKVAIVGGAVAGGVIGHKIATRDNDDDSYTCRQRGGYYEEQRHVGYDVYYLFHGRRHVLRTLYEPARRLHLRVEVVAKE